MGNAGFLSSSVVRGLGLGLRLRVLGDLFFGFRGVLDMTSGLRGEGWMDGKSVQAQMSDPRVLP